MSYIIWQTDHPINQTVTNAFAEGYRKLSRTGMVQVRNVSTFDPEKDIKPCISYGILRGAGEIFKACRAKGVEFWEIDRGYFKPGHFDGYYRISLNGMHVWNYDARNNYDTTRIDGFNVEIKPWRYGSSGDYILLCPPSQPVKWFEKVPEDFEQIIIDSGKRLYPGIPFKIRNKSSDIPLYQDLEAAIALHTYNSNAVIDALVAGVSVKAYGIHPVNEAIPEKRRNLFSYLANNQFTLDEMRSGMAWEMVQQQKGSQ